MSEEVKEEAVIEGPGLYQIFLKGKLIDSDMKDHFETINSIPSGASLMIWLNSPGGAPAVNLMLTDKLAAKGFNVTYISYLYNGSAACTLPHIGDAIRLAYHNSVFTFHGGTYSVDGREEHFNMIKKYATEGIEKINALVMERVGLTKKEFKKYDGEDIILFGYQLLDIGEHGYVDGLILKEVGVGEFLIKTRDGNKLIDVSKHKRSDLKDLPVVE